MNDHKLRIGHKVKYIRELKKYSQEYVAAKMGISQNAFSKIEREEIQLTFDKACKIAKILETDINAIINSDTKNFLKHRNQLGLYNSTINAVDKSIDELIKTKNKLIQEQEEHIKLLQELLEKK